MSLSIDGGRLRNSFETYSKIGATENDGLHRLALSESDRQVRDQFVEDLHELGLDVRIDELGNIFGRREGGDPDADPVLIGSHLDSQPYGGRFDGQLGILIALETLRTINENGIEHRRPIEIVNWTNEEGSRFQPGLMGSKVFAEQLSVEEALATEDRDGITVGEALEEIGYDGDEPCEPFDVHSFLELHVEQGSILETSGNSVGVVDGAFGIAWFEVTIEGQADHSGPTPMHNRRDALATAADAIKSLRSLPQQFESDTVLTVGQLDVSPGSINVIPETVRFTVDIRSFDAAVIEAVPELVEFEVATAAEREGTEYELTQLDEQMPLEFSSLVVDAVHGAAEELDVSYQHIISGAGHDAKPMQSLTDAGMIFVPSVDGLTHTESELTEWADVLSGASVYANTVTSLMNAE